MARSLISDGWHDYKREKPPEWLETACAEYLFAHGRVMGGFNNVTWRVGRCHVGNMTLPEMVVDDEAIAWRPSPMCICAKVRGL